MKTIKNLLVLFLTLSIFSCSDDDTPSPLQDIESSTYENLYAPELGGRGAPASGEFVKFDFTTGEVTQSETEWDIAFRATTIIINGGEVTGLEDEPARTGLGGAYIHDEVFANISEVNEERIKEDNQTDGLAITKGSGNGWYTYSSQTHIISPTVNKNLIIKTRDGKYAKVKILNYYKDREDTDYTKSGYYAFEYVYQPNEGVTSFE